MNLAAAVVLALNLVAGSVRDQHGVPIEGARVVVRSGATVTAITTTAADGTFLVEASGTSIEIRCAYCRTLRTTADQQGIVAAVVTRYDAPFAQAPVDADIAHLPLASATDLLAITPYVVVNQTARTVPGASATDRNATPYGGLLVVDDAPAYDATAGASTFDTLAQGSLSALHVLRVDRAYLYGNLAQGGTFIADTPGGTSDAAGGSNDALRAALDTGRLDAAASYANANAGLHAQRAAARLAIDTPGTTGTIALSSGAGYSAPTGVAPLDSAFSSAAVEVHGRARADVFARMLADRGTYDYRSARFAENSVWSDTDLEAGIDSRATLAPFLHLDERTTAGAYTSRDTGSDPVSGYLSVSRLSAGLQYHTQRLDAFAAGGAGTARYSGVLTPTMSDARSIDDAVLSATFHPNDLWSLHASTSSGYTLQTFVGVYVPAQAGIPYLSPVISGHTNEGTVEYGDQSRVRVSATALSWSGDAASTSSAGASVAWQVAPNIALRTWFLHETSTLWAPGNVGSAWLTFANGDAFRADLMWQRTLLDRVPHSHLNLSVGGRLNAHLDWFASSTSVLQMQQTAFGIRVR